MKKLTFIIFILLISSSNILFAQLDTFRLIHLYNFDLILYTNHYRFHAQMLGATGTGGFASEKTGKDKDVTDTTIANIDFSANKRNTSSLVINDGLIKSKIDSAEVVIADSNGRRMEVSTMILMVRGKNGHSDNHTNQVDSGKLSVEMINILNSLQPGDLIGFHVFIAPPMRRKYPISNSSFTVRLN